MYKVLVEITNANGKLVFVDEAKLEGIYEIDRFLRDAGRSIETCEVYLDEDDWEEDEDMAE